MAYPDCVTLASLLDYGQSGKSFFVILRLGHLRTRIEPKCGSVQPPKISTIWARKSLSRQSKLSFPRQCRYGIINLKIDGIIEMRDECSTAILGLGG